MIKLTLNRRESSDHGTLGKLIAPGFGCCTIEPPWRDNQVSASCIPPGEYICRVRESARFGHVYHVKGVPGRTCILIHAGNVAGDREKGLKTHSSGCILVGKSHGWLYGQEAVLSSKATLRRFMACMKGRELQLLIRGDFHE